jgi:hypothetical protein
MADEQKHQQGGFHFGKVGGKVAMTAGGDIVGGDKITTTTIQKGFAAEEQKTQFQTQIDQLRDALRAFKMEIESHPALSSDQKEEIVSEVLQQVTALKQVKEKTAELPAGKPAPADVGSFVEETLGRAGKIVEKFQSLAKSTGEVAAKVGEFGVKYAPLILSARHLFGLQ